MTTAQCDDCGAIWGEDELHAALLDDENDPDEVLGECPDCGALCYAVEDARVTGRSPLQAANKRRGARVGRA